MAETRKKTTDKIKKGLLDMLGTASIDDITATDLCKHIRLNRATFYYHYNSVQDVLTEIEREVENEFKQFLAQSSTTEDGTPEKNFYVTFFEFAARNAALCRMLLGAKTRSEFLQHAMEAGRSKVMSIMSKQFPNCPAAKIDRYYIFVSNGFLGLLEHWFASGMHESINDLAEVGEQVSFFGIKYLQ